MKPNDSTYKDTVLINWPKRITVHDVETHLDKGDSAARKELASVIYHRLYRRYVVPLASVPEKHRSGFLTMAASCLMIEALQSFREGREYTREKGAGKECFRNFFAETKAFSAFRTVSDDFYKNVRCGILHQAETYGEWRILRKRDSPLFDAAKSAINADKFLESLGSVLAAYRHDLEGAEWNSLLWRAARTKLQAICDHCQPGAGQSPTK